MDEQSIKLISGAARAPTRGNPKRLPAIRRRLAEAGLDRRVDRNVIPYKAQRQAQGDRNFRLAVAHSSDVAHDVESAWTVYDFTSTDLGVPATKTDRQDLRVMHYDDGGGVYSCHDVTVGQFPVAADLRSLDPDGVDWLAHAGGRECVGVGRRWREYVGCLGRRRERPGGGLA